MARPDPEIHALIRRLTLGTQQGKVTWTAQNDQWFDLTTGGVTVMIRSDNPSGDEHPYSFELTNDQGATLGRASTIEGEYYADWEQDMEALFKAARSQALGVDRAIEGLASELDLPELPPPPIDDDIPF